MRVRTKARAHPFHSLPHSIHKWSGQSGHVHIYQKSKHKTTTTTVPPSHPRVASSATETQRRAQWPLEATSGRGPQARRREGRQPIRRPAHAAPRSTPARPSGDVTTRRPSQHFYATRTPFTRLSSRLQHVYRASPGKKRCKKQRKKKAHSIPTRLSVIISLQVWRQPPPETKIIYFLI